MKKSLMILVLLFLPIINGYTQEIKKIENDTVITITPKQLRLINLSIQERKSLKKEVTLLDSLRELDKQNIENLNRTLYYKDQVIQDTEKLGATKVKKWKKKSAFFGVVGIAIGFVLGKWIL